MCVSCSYFTAAVNIIGLGFAQERLHMMACVLGLMIAIHGLGTSLVDLIPRPAYEKVWA